MDAHMSRGRVAAQYDFELGGVILWQRKESRIHFFPVEFDGLNVESSRRTMAGLSRIERNFILTGVGSANREFSLIVRLARER